MSGFILFGKLNPKAAEVIVGAKGEIPLASGTKKEMREKAKKWEKLGEACRIVRISDGKEVK